MEGKEVNMSQILNSLIYCAEKTTIKNFFFKFQDFYNTNIQFTNEDAELLGAQKNIRDTAGLYL